MLDWIGLGALALLVGIFWRLGSLRFDVEALGRQLAVLCDLVRKSNENADRRTGEDH